MFKYVFRYKDTNINIKASNDEKAYDKLVKTTYGKYIKKIKLISVSIVGKERKSDKKNNN